MIQKIIVLLGISLFLCTACQQEDDLFTNTQEDMKLVSLSLSVDNGLETGTEYVPMGTRADDANIFITNSYHYIIAEKTEDGRYVVTNKGEERLKPTSARYGIVDIIHKESHKGFDILLRPGKYEMMVYTGAYSIIFNSDIKEGTVLPDPNDKTKQLWALTYETSTEHENDGARIVGEEVFFGKTSFTVEKTDSLSKKDQPNIVPIEIILERRVAKIRTLLKETITPTPAIPTIESMIVGNRNPVISLDMERKDGKDFATGLDVWGNLCNRPGESIPTFSVCVNLHNKPMAGEDGVEYFISNATLKVYYPYIFCMPGEEIEIRTGTVKCSMGSMATGMMYYGSHELTIKNNTINGLVLELTDQWDVGGKDMILKPVYSSSGTLLVPDINLFKNNYEFSTF